jgi:hypothetical protein
MTRPCPLDCECGRHNEASRKARLEELAARHARRDRDRGDVPMTGLLREYLGAFDDRVEAWRTDDTRGAVAAEQLMHRLLYGRDV